MTIAQALFAPRNDSDKVKSENLPVSQLYEKRETVANKISHLETKLNFLSAELHDKPKDSRTGFKALIGFFKDDSRTKQQKLNDALLLLLDLSNSLTNKASMSDADIKKVKHDAKTTDVLISETSLGKKLNNTFIQYPNGTTTKFSEFTIDEGIKFLERYLERCEKSEVGECSIEYNRVTYDICRSKRELSEIDEQIEAITRQTSNSVGLSCTNL